MIRTITSIDGALVVTFSCGRIDISVASLIRDALVERVEDATEGMILDFSVIEFIDSSGVGALVAVLKRLGGRMVLFGCRPIVKQVLALTHLDRVMKSVATQEDALAVLAQMDAPGPIDESVLNRALFR